VLDDPEIDQVAAREFGMRTALYVPLVLRDEAIGVIAARDKRGGDPRFTDDDMRLAEVFAQRASVAVDLSQRVARDALQRVVTAQEAERQRLARELHDEAGQSLTSMLVRLRALERDVHVRDDASLRARLTDVVQVGEQLHGELSRLARGLHPGVLENLGLEAALRLLAAQARKSGLRVDADLWPGPRLPRPIELAAYRIVQESTTNAVKHARAKTLKIHADWSGAPALRLIVEDDGVGFDPASLADGIGLLGIRERVRHLGGLVDLQSAPSRGTRIDVIIPADEPEKNEQPEEPAS
jgi:signal transduction histidine kinase